GDLAHAVLVDEPRAAGRPLSHELGRQWLSANTERLQARDVGRTQLDGHGRRQESRIGLQDVDVIGEVLDGLHGPWDAAAAARDQGYQELEVANVEGVVVEAKIARGHVEAQVFNVVADGRRVRPVYLHDTFGFAGAT